MDGDTQKRPTPHRSPGKWQGVLHRALPDFRCGACGALDWDAMSPDWGGEDEVGVLHFAHWKTGQLSGSKLFRKKREVLNKPCKPFVKSSCFQKRKKNGSGKPATGIVILKAFH